MSNKNINLQTYVKKINDLKYSHIHKVYKMTIHKHKTNFII